MDNDDPLLLLESVDRLHRSIESIAADAKHLFYLTGQLKGLDELRRNGYVGLQHVRTTAGNDFLIGTNDIKPEYRTSHI